MERDANGIARFDYSVEAQRRTDAEQRTLRRASVARIAAAYRHPMALAEALESRTDTLHLATLDQESRIAARDGYYADAEVLADAWLTLDEGTYHGAFKPEPAPAPMHTCQTRAEWAQVWDDAVEAGSWLTRQWYARQQRAALQPESLPTAITDLMGASSTYVLDISDGLTVRDITNVERNHRVKRNRAQYVERDADTEPDALYGRWRECDRTQSPTVWRNGKVAAGVDGRASERAALAAARRAVRLAQMRAINTSRRNDEHTISADLTAMLQRARAGTSER